MPRHEAQHTTYSFRPCLTSPIFIQGSFFKRDRHSTKFATVNDGRSSIFFSSLQVSGIETPTPGRARGE